MSLRWQFERDGRFNVPFKVEIYDSEYNESPITLEKIGSNPVEVQMGEIGGDPLEKIKASFITVRLFGETGDFEDLHTRNNERFLVKLYVNGNHEADFIPIPDTFTDYVTDGQYTNEIKCANLSLFKQKQIDDIINKWPIPIGPVTTAVSRQQVIEDIIEELFDLPVVDGVVFHPSHVTASNPSLSNQYINPQRLKGLNCYEALEMLIPKGHQYRISKGKVFILPVTEASFIGWEGTPTLYDDNFQSCKIGGQLSKTRKRLRTYDGVRRFYNPLEADNIVLSGDFELEDFGLEEDDIDSSGKTEARPLFWTATRGNTETYWNTFAKLISGGTAWELPESIGEFISQSSIEAGGTRTWESWVTDSGLVLAGTRLKIDLSFNYFSINDYAHLPIKIKVDDQILFRGRDASGRLVAGNPIWRTESNGLIRHVDHVLIGAKSNVGLREYSFLTPPIPKTGRVTIEIETPSVDRGYQERSSQIVRNYIEIASFEIYPADESGDILIDSDILAGSNGDVYEYTEGFGDGFTQFNKGAMYDGSSYTSRNLTSTWFYSGNDGNVSDDELSLADLESSYLASQLTTDRDRLNGTVDVFDFIALIDGYRVNYIKTDFRYGRSEIELIQIRDHDIEAIVEERKRKVTARPVFIDFPPLLLNYYQINAIGEITESIENEQRTEIGVEIDQPLRVGIEYWIINENELSREDRRAGIYSIDAQATDSNGDPVDDDTEGATLQYGPGLLDGIAADKLPIQEQLINAPRGSLIVKAPGQQEVEDNVFQERIDEANENLDNLNNVELPALQAALDDLNNVQLPALQDDLDQLESDLNTLNTVTLPGLESDLQDLNNELDDILPITETKISDNAISTPKLQTNSVTAGKIATDAVIANKIAAGAVTAIKIDTDAVTANKIAAGAVIAGKIGADAVVANNIASNAVTTNKIQAGAITTDKIGANQVTANKIDVDDLAANTAFIVELFAQNINFTGKISRTIGSQDIIIGANLNDEKLNRPQALFGFAASGGVPFAHVRSDSNNFVEMVGRDGAGSDPFFQVVSGGSTVFKVDRGGSWSINNTGGDFDIAEDGIAILTGNEVLERSIVWRDTLPSGTLRAELTTASSPNRFLLRSSNGYEMALIGDGDTLLRSVNGNVELDPVSGYLIAIGLPTSNPGGTNRIWRDAGALKIT